MKDSIKVKINPRDFVNGLKQHEDGSGFDFDEQAICVYLVDALTTAGINAEAQYQDTDWSIVIDSKRYYPGMGLFDDPATALLDSVRNFADEVNSGDHFDAWYSYSNGEDFLTLRPKDGGD